MLVTLTTDFGIESPYVPAMKGVLLSVNQDATLLDLSHRIPPQNLSHAAYFLSGCLPYFPSGTLHVVVVDPGVGTGRALLHIAVGGQQILVPDNGCWVLAARAMGTPTVRKLTESRFWRRTVSATFHGRDILAPVAGYLSLGIDPSALGPVLTEWAQLPLAAPTLGRDTVVGEVVFVDSFGNLMTNIPGEAFMALGTDIEFQLDAPVQPRVVRSYGDAPPGVVVALIASQGMVELAVTQGNAAQTLNFGVGTPVVVRRAGAGHGPNS